MFLKQIACDKNSCAFIGTVNTRGYCYKFPTFFV
ncbi:MAG: hypothetical protein D8M18_08995 [Bacteroidetes bacterium]|nr:hypothetical protein [Bacteroidota bacterium]